jgi:hypothetical protein
MIIDGAASTDNELLALDSEGRSSGGSPSVASGCRAQAPSMTIPEKADTPFFAIPAKVRIQSVYAVSVLIPTALEGFH